MQAPSMSWAHCRQWAFSSTVTRKPEGRVLSGGPPVEEAEIVASSLHGQRFDSDVSSTSGEYRLDVPRAEEYILEVSAPRRKPVELELTVPENAGEVRRDIELPPP